MNSKSHDWRQPWRSLLEFCSIVLAHAVGIVVIACVAEILERILTAISKTTLVWTVRSVELKLSDIVHYGDLFIVIAFFSVAIFDIYKWAKSQ